MEVLDEFDSELPQTVTFCRRISREAFERQAVTYTSRALRRLFRSIDLNPALAERAVRRGKQAECERRGLVSFLWAKFFCAVQGDMNYCNRMGSPEMHRRLDQLKRSIYRVHLYSRDKKRKKLIRKKTELTVLQDQSTSPHLPPTLLPPSPLPPPTTTITSVLASASPLYTMPRVFGPFPQLPSKLMEKLDISKSDRRLNWNGLSSNPKSHVVNLCPLVLNPRGFHFSCLAQNSTHKLHFSDLPWTTACSASPNAEDMPLPSVKASVTSPPVLLKFQPIHKPSDDSENDRGSSECLSQKKST